MKRHVFFSSLAAVAIAGSVVWTQAVAQRAPSESVDAVFARWNTSSPGCAVGVGVDGKSVLERAYGMADLEHDVRNVPGTIFEAGSVSKQFTAAAVLLLAGRQAVDRRSRAQVHSGTA